MPKVKDEVYKAFVFKFMNKEDADLFDKFRLLMLTQGCSVELRFLHWIKLTIENHPLDFTPVLEADAIPRLAADGLETSRVTLKKYRDKGVLVDENDKPFWFTDGHAIAYNYELLKKFVEIRKESGVEPLVPSCESSTIGVG